MISLKKWLKKHEQVEEVVNITVPFVMLFALFAIGLYAPLVLPRLMP